jgi:hypothetical protein
MQAVTTLYFEPSLAWIADDMQAWLSAAFSFRSFFLYRHHDHRRNDHCTDAFGQAFPVCQAAVSLVPFLLTLLAQHSAGVFPPAPPPSGACLLTQSLLYRT